jgi:hypothetical protein
MLVSIAVQIDAQGPIQQLDIKSTGILQGDTFKKISSIPSFPYADGWLGGDGALSVQLSDTRVLWIMSDSYVSHKTKLRKRRKFWTIVNNVVAIADYEEDPASIDYYWKSSRKHHRAFFVPDSGNYRFWTVWGFLRGDTVYVLMTEVEDREVLFTGQVNGSLEYYPDLGIWLYVYGPNFLSNEIRYRFAKQITGPWSESGVLYQTPEQTPGHTSYDKRHFCYLGRTHSAFYNSESGKLLLTYDYGSTEFFHTATSDFIYIPRVVVLDVHEEIKEKTDEKTSCLFTYYAGSVEHAAACPGPVSGPATDC